MVRAERPGKEAEVQIETITPMAANRAKSIGLEVLAREKRRDHGAGERTTATNILAGTDTVNGTEMKELAMNFDY